MPRCLFCERDYEKLSEEHVFPASLGGRLVVKDCVCTECNNGFSRFEQPVAQELAPIRWLLKIPDRYGKPPEVAATAITSDKEYQAKIKRDGSLRLKPVVTVEMGPDGSKVIWYLFPTELQKEQMRREAQENKIQFLEGGPGEPKEAEIHVIRDLEFLGSSEGLRTAAKIGFVALAYRFGIEMASSPSFKTVRDYIRTGAPPLHARLFVHEGFLRGVDAGPHQHLVIIAGRRDKHRVDAIVRLFSGLAYFVTLSENYGGADFYNTLVYDSYRGEENGILASNLQGEFLQTEEIATSPMTVWDDMARSAEWFINYLNAEIQAKIKRDAANTSPKT